MKKVRLSFRMNRIWLFSLLFAVTASTQFCTIRDGSTRLFELYEQTQKYEQQLWESSEKRFIVLTMDELEQEYEYWSGIYEQLKQIDREALEKEDQVSYDLFKRDVLRELRDYEFQTYLVPINHEGGFHTRPIGVASRMFADSLKDYEDYISRLNSIPEYFTQNISFMRRGTEIGYTLPKPVLVEEYKQPIRSQIVDNPEESVFYRPFKSFPSFVQEGDRERLRESARTAINESVIPSYKNFLTFMEEEYIPNARESIGLSALPGGENYYKYLVTYYTTLDITPQEVHEIGMKEVNRIRSEMEAIIKKVDFQGSFDEFLEFLRTDPQFYVDEPEELMEEAAHIAKRMDGQLPKLFNTLPRQPYGIEPVPAHLAPRYTGGRYSLGGEGEAGNYWVNTYNLKSRPLYTLEALTFHEAVPGHHLQIALAKELENLSKIRQRASLAAFSEGWALYSERLGLEAGFYQDPYSNFGRLTYEMWRACRLVVDTGMHVLGWPREKAINFMTENTALSHHEIDTEINRYISVPGQALAYKMGELEIRKLRVKAEEELSSNFDIRAFHDAILLGGPVPLPVLQQQVQGYIEEHKKS